MPLTARLATWSAMRLCQWPVSVQRPLHPWAPSLCHSLSLQPARSLVSAPEVQLASYALLLHLLSSALVCAVDAVWFGGGVGPALNFQVVGNCSVLQLTSNGGHGTTVYTGPVPLAPSGCNVRTLPSEYFCFQHQQILVQTAAACRCPGTSNQTISASLSRSSILASPGLCLCLP